MLPDGLKRLVLPSGIAATGSPGAPASIRGAVRPRFGVCDVCGRFGPWLYRRRVVSPKLAQLWGLN